MQDPNTTSQLSRADQTLLLDLQGGEDSAVAALEGRYGGELRLFCQRMLSDSGMAEDVVQDILAKCCALSREQAPARSLRGWLYQLARNRCIDLLRRRRERSLPGMKSDDGPRPMSPVDPCTTPSGKALKRERALRILGCLDDLDDELRTIIVLRYFQDLSREQIAEAMGLSERSVKSRISKAILALRKRLGSLDDSSFQ